MFTIFFENDVRLQNHHVIWTLIKFTNRKKHFSQNFSILLMNANFFLNSYQVKGQAQIAILEAQLHRSDGALLR